MKAIIILILIILVCMVDSDINIFNANKESFSINKQQQENKKLKNKLQFNNKILCETYFNRRNVWIFNKSDNNKIIQKCIDYNISKLQNSFEIRLFTYNNIKNLIPEFSKYINLCRSEYLFENLLKYAILFKYGGLWIPEDTIIINDLQTDFQDTTEKIHLYGLNDPNYCDNPGFSDDIILCNKNNNSIKLIVQYIISSIYSFHNSTNYKLTINKHINSISNDLIHFEDYTLQKNIYGKFIDPNLIIDKYYDEIDTTHKYFYILHYDKLTNKTKHTLNITDNMNDSNVNFIQYINKFIN